MRRNKYAIYHVLAMVCAAIGFYIIYKISCYLFLPLQKEMTIVKYAKLLWATHDWFFRGLLVVNFLIKPVFIYYLTWVSLTLYSGHKNNLEKK